MTRSFESSTRFQVLFSRNSDHSPLFARVLKFKRSSLEDFDGSRVSSSSARRTTLWCVQLYTAASSPSSTRPHPIQVVDTDSYSTLHLSLQTIQRDFCIMGNVIAPIVGFAALALSHFFRPDRENPTFADIHARRQAEEAQRQAEQAAREAQELAEEIRQQADRDREQARARQEEANQAAARAAEEAERMRAQMEEAASATRHAQELAEAAASACQGGGCKSYAGG
ncbi:hypothetical protein J3R83DRAFT_1284 [Lanmaoa asiatica]|nr:hypothetical protein J3R83DRAFT_1284 [Lanmaoa asiatica]